MIRKAHFYWGNTTLPWFQHLAIRSFVAAHPSWEVMLWRPFDQTHYPAGADHTLEVEAVGVQVIHVDPDSLTGTSLEGYDSTNAWCQVSRSDALRHWLLYEHGGLWSDTDVLWFRSVKGSSLDQGDVAIIWDGDYVHTAVISANRTGATVLKTLLDRQREISPAYQPPGGQGPFGPGLWTETLLDPGKVSGLARARYIEFISEPNPESVAYHSRGARVPWGSMNVDNYAEQIRAAISSPEGEHLITAIDRVVPCLG